MFCSPPIKGENAEAEPIATWSWIVSLGCYYLPAVFEDFEINQPPSVEFTRQRLVAGTVILLVASAPLLAAVDPVWYFTGAACGILSAGLVAWMVIRRRKPQR
jgi:hypothetical protein